MKTPAWQRKEDQPPNGEKEESMKDFPLIGARKKKAREIRKGMMRENPEGGYSTHIMQYGQDDKGKFVASPTLFPKGKRPSTNPKDWVEKQGGEGFAEAQKRGELFFFNKEKKAAKFAAGSWKKGKDRKEAMKRFKQKEK